MSTTKNYAWVCCEVCGNTDVDVERFVGDRGGTESLGIQCDNCGHSTNVIP